MMRDTHDLKFADALMHWSVRPDLSCDHLSPAWLDFTGSRPEQALGAGWSLGVRPEALARGLDRCLRACDEREPFEIKYRLRRHDGEYRWVLYRAVPHYGRGGTF